MNRRSDVKPSICDARQRDIKQEVGVRSCQSPSLSKEIKEGGREGGGLKVFDISPGRNYNSL